jgi:protein ImuA
MAMHDSDIFLPVIKGRTHEVCGAGAYMFAFALMATRTGPVMWIHEAWEPRQINPAGFMDFTDPTRLIVCKTQTQTDTLAVAEESLRDGAVSLVVMVLNKPIGLTEGRRLQLSAGAGRSTGLAIIPDGMGSNAAQTRWNCTPSYNALQKMALTKNKTGTLSEFNLRLNSPLPRRPMPLPHYA